MKTMNFKKGDIVYGSQIAVLVTGKAKKEFGEDCFSGVVISKIQKIGEYNHHSVATYSDRWAKSCFEESKFHFEMSL